MDPGSSAQNAEKLASDTEGRYEVAAVAKELSYMDALLQDAAKSKQTCSIYLTNGIKLTGVVVAVDAVSILLQDSKNSAIPIGINRFAVATAVPMNPGYGGPARRS